MFGHAELLLLRDERLKASESKEAATDFSDLKAIARGLPFVKHPSTMPAKGSVTFSAMPCGVWNANNTSQRQDPNQPESSTVTSRPTPVQSTASPGKEADIPDGAAAIQDSMDNASAWANDSTDRPTTTAGRQKDDSVSSATPVQVMDGAANGSRTSSPSPGTGGYNETTTAAPLMPPQSDGADVTGTNTAVTGADPESHMKTSNTTAPTPSDRSRATTSTDVVSTAGDNAASTPMEAGKSNTSGNNEGEVHSETSTADAAGSTPGSSETLEAGTTSDGNDTREESATIISTPPIPAEADSISTVRDGATMSPIGNSDVSTPTSAPNDAFTVETNKTILPDDTGDPAGTTVAQLPKQADDVSTTVPQSSMDTTETSATNMPMQNGSEGIAVPTPDDTSAKLVITTEAPNTGYGKAVTKQTIAMPTGAVTVIVTVHPSSNGTSIKMPQESGNVIIPASTVSNDDNTGRTTTAATQPGNKSSSDATEMPIGADNVSVTPPTRDSTPAPVRGCSAAQVVLVPARKVTIATENVTSAAEPALSSDIMTKTSYDNSTASPANGGHTTDTSDSNVSTPNTEQQTVTTKSVPVNATGTDAPVKSTQADSDITGRIGTVGTTTKRSDGTADSSSATPLTSTPSQGRTVTREATVDTSDIGTSPMSDNTSVAGTTEGMVQSTASLGASPTTSESDIASPSPSRAPSTDNSRVTGVKRTTAITGTDSTTDIIAATSQEDDRVVITTPSPSPTARGSAPTESFSSATTVTPGAVSSTVPSTATTSVSSTSSSTMAVTPRSGLVFPYLPTFPRPLSPKSLGEQRNTINLDHLPAIPHPVRPRRLH